MEALEIAQKNSLYSEIKNKNRHEKLYRAFNNELIDIERSSLCMTNGNIRAVDQAYLCYL